MRCIRHRTIILVNAIIHFNCIIAIATTIRDTTTTIQVSHPHSHSSSSTTTDYYTTFFIGIPPMGPQLMLLLLYCAIKLHQLIGHCLSGLSHHLLQFTSVTLIPRLEEPGRYTTLTPTSGPSNPVYVVHNC